MDSAAIMLIPDQAYRDLRPDVKEPHLTLAWYGASSQQPEGAHEVLVDIVRGIKLRTKRPIKAKSNGIGMLRAGTDGVAIVDLLNGYGISTARDQCVAYDGWQGVKIDKRNGFLPHMSIEFVDEADVNPLSFTSALNIDFTFTAVGLWWDDERYEVTL